MSFRTPGYRLHKPSGQAVVTLNGKDLYLGKHATAESRAEYDRLIAEWLANGRGRPKVVAVASEATVNEILIAFWKHAERYYRTRDGQPTQELDNLRDALRHVRKLFGHTLVASFGPLSLLAVREEMIRSGLARTTINARIHRIRRCFGWAVSVELAPGSLMEALRQVRALEYGRSDAREADEVKPVPVEHVEATLPHLPRPVAAMVRLQLLTGCRAGEILVMRGHDLTFGEPTWTFRPAAHKNTWRGQDRLIPLGPQAQAIIKEFLKPDLAAYLFAPRAAVAAHHARRAQARQSKRTPSEMVRRRSEPGQGHAPRYDRRTYRQAIVRGCRKAGVPEWTPLQLRHTAGTDIRARFGLEAASNVLGHAKPDTTLIYAERDLAKAHAIAAEIG